MDYNTIISIALGYADRSNTKVVSMVDNFIQVVEARINRKLMTQKMSATLRMPIVTGQYSYALPSDFLADRAIRIMQLEQPSQGKTLTMVNPEQMTNAMSVSAGYLAQNNLQPEYVYNIAANSINIWPIPTNDIITPITYELEILYYKRLTNLSATNSMNWLSLDNPDCYIFGLLVEINSFVKDPQAATMWNGRFEAALDEITNLDDISTYSGTPLTTKVG